MNSLFESRDRLVFSFSFPCTDNRQMHRVGQTYRVGEEACTYTTHSHRNTDVCTLTHTNAHTSNEFFAG